MQFHLLGHLATFAGWRHPKGCFFKLCALLNLLGLEQYYYSLEVRQTNRHCLDYHIGIKQQWFLLVCVWGGGALGSQKFL